MAQKDSEQIDAGAEGRNSRSRQFNKFLENYFKVIVIGIAAVIFIFGFFVLLLPKYEQTVKYVDVFNKQQSLDVSDLQSQLKKTQQLIASYDNISQEDVAKIAAIAPAVQNKEELFSELNYLVSTNQLILQSISLSSASGYQDQGLLPITGVSITLSLAGVNYTALKNFLSVLENNLRLMDVTHLTFSPQGESVQMSINTYYSK